MNGSIILVALSRWRWCRQDGLAGENKRIYYYTNEPNGCPSRLLDENGKVVWPAMYGAWGKVKRLPVELVEQPIRLQGQYFDVETGLHYNRFRYYCPEIGAFVSQDPLRLAAGENVYRFGPNVQKWIDPLGLSCKTISKNGISDEDFVRFDPVKVRGSINKSGVQTKFFSDKKVWITKYKYVKDVTNPSDLETMLYRKNLQQYTTGKFSSGADLYKLNNIDDAVPAGITNMSNGIPQWRITRDIPASDIEMIKTLNSLK